MRVVHVFSALYQGGAENQLELLLNQSFRATPEVKHMVISLKSEITPLWKRLEKMGVTVLSCNLNSPLDVKGILNLRRMISAFSGEKDIIQCWMYHANFFSTIASVGLKNNIVWNIRRTQIPQGITGLIAKFSGFMSYLSKPYIVSNSYAGLDSHVAAGYNKSRMKVIPNGFDTSVSIQDVEGGEVSYKEDDSDFIFGHVGRYAPVKGHRYIFEAISILEKKLSKATFDKIKFVFIGRGVSDAQDLKVYTSNSKLMEKCVFLGEKEHISPLLQQFDCFVLPSESEGFPNCLVEAMLAAKPCVATDVGDVKLIGDNVILLSSAYSSIELANNMLIILNKSESERKAMGENLQMIASNKYSIFESWKQYFNLYNKILGNT
ncbi:glycosyltransferase [Colwellia sp. TT2012]|uniref:glycosyltransferase n=1 Tax=Colwellia sp. TT2012 TaxID=1720342 RepID=UPI00070A1525|nr:glycosyltransferase [Colwellia sp. TT2012]